MGKSCWHTNVSMSFGKARNSLGSLIGTIYWCPASILPHCRPHSPPLSVHIRMQRIFPSTSWNPVLLNKVGEQTFRRKLFFVVVWNSIIIPAKEPKQFTLQRLMDKGIHSARMYNDEKLVVLPKRIRGFWMHSAYFLANHTRPVQLYTNYSIMLHLANEDRLGENEFQMPLLAGSMTHASESIDRHVNGILQHLAKQKVPAVCNSIWLYYPFIHSNQLHASGVGQIAQIAFIF